LGGPETGSFEGGINPEENLLLSECGSGGKKIHSWGK
jgi:hypothetical protein